MTARSLSAWIVAVATLALLSLPLCAADAEIPKEIVAVQVRKQGFECKNPESATRDADASKPDNEVWILACEGVRYKVQLVPKQAATIERIEEPKPPEASDAAEPPEAAKTR